MTDTASHDALPPGLQPESFIRANSSRNCGGTDTDQTAQTNAVPASAEGCTRSCQPGVTQLPVLQNHSETQV